MRSRRRSPYQPSYQQPQPRIKPWLSILRLALAYIASMRSSFCLACCAASCSSAVPVSSCRSRCSFFCPLSFSSCSARSNPSSRSFACARTCRHGGADWTICKSQGGSRMGKGLSYRRRACAHARSICSLTLKRCLSSSAFSHPRRQAATQYAKRGRMIADATVPIMPRSRRRRYHLKYHVFQLASTPWLPIRLMRVRGGAGVIIRRSIAAAVL